jgi:hypothetical protein
MCVVYSLARCQPVLCMYMHVSNRSISARNGSAMKQCCGLYSARTGLQGF